MTGTDPLAQLLAALILLCGFGLLAYRGLAPQITLLRSQAYALAAAACWTACTQKAPQLLLAAVIILALQGLLLPAMLRRIAPQSSSPGTGLALAVPLGIFVLLLALLLAPLALAVPLAVILLGLLVLVLRRDPLGQTIGLFSAEAGLMLSAINFPGLPIVLLTLAALALPAALLAGVIRLRPRGDLTSLETASPETSS